MSYHSYKYDNSNKHDDMLKESCVKITNINKINRVSRHLDDLLISVSSQIGPIMYMHTYRRASHINNTTSCFIQLENWNKHELLTEIFNQLDFHGTLLRAELSTFNFQFDDNEYHPRSIGCTFCKNAVSNKCDSTTPQTNRYFNRQSHLNIPPQINNIHSPSHSTQKRRLSSSSFHNEFGTTQNKQPKVNHTPVEYIPIESDNSSDSNYETIQIKSEPTPSTIKLSTSISNIHLSTTINTSIQEQQSTITNEVTPHQTTSSTNLITTTPQLIDSATTPSSIDRCSTCQINLSTQYFKPLIAQPQKFDKTCPHRYCTTCLTHSQQRATTVSVHGMVIQ